MMRSGGLRSTGACALGLVLALVGQGCGQDSQESAELRVRLTQNPYSQRFSVPGNPTVVEWSVIVPLEIRSSNCVDAALSLVDVEVVHPTFGSFGFSRLDRAALEGHSDLVGCAAVALRTSVGVYGNPTPLEGSVTVVVRAVAVDARGATVAAQLVQQAPLEARP